MTSTTTTTPTSRDTNSLLTAQDVLAIEQAIHVVAAGIEPNAADRQALALATYWPGCKPLAAQTIRHIFDGCSLPLNQRRTRALARLAWRLPDVTETDEHATDSPAAMSSISERVAQGAALLDVKRPGWEQQIDVDTLNIAMTDRCVVGQLFGGEDDSYDRGIDELFLIDTCENPDAPELVAHGFIAPANLRWQDADQEWAALTEEWKRLILHRRSQLTAPEILDIRCALQHAAAADTTTLSMQDRQALTRLATWPNLPPASRVLISWLADPHRIDVTLPATGDIATHLLNLANLLPAISEEDTKAWQTARSQQAEPPPYRCSLQEGLLVAFGGAAYRTTPPPPPPALPLDVVLETIATYVADHDGDAGGGHMRTMLLAALIVTDGTTTPDEAINLARNDRWDSRVTAAGQTRDLMVERIKRARLTAIDDAWTPQPGDTVTRTGTDGVWIVGGREDDETVWVHRPGVRMVPTIGRNGGGMVDLAGWRDEPERSELATVAELRPAVQDAKVTA